MNLTQKETELLKDLKSQEKLCIEKYSKGAAAACDCGLKDLFNYLGETEQSHLNMLNAISAGQVPTTGGGRAKPQITNSGCNCNEQQKKTDGYLCADALALEKHASSLYDTSIFEFSAPELRNVLNSIQKDEQEHGEMLYSYMSQNNIYSI